MIYAIIGAVVLGLTLLCTFIWRRVVPTNMVHIVQSAKKSVSYGPSQPAGNTYYEFPSFLPIIGVTVSKFQESVFAIPLKDYEAYDKGRLPFTVDVQAFFRINDSQTAAKRVATFQELQGQLLGILQGVVRRIMATNELEQILEARSSLGEQFTNEVDSQLKEWGVTTVKMIEIMDIKDSSGSQVIHNIMAKEKSRIEMESRIAVAANQQEAKSKEIEAQRTIETNQIEAQQQIGIRDAEMKKTVGLATEKSNQDIQAEAKITAERQMEVLKVQSVKQAEIQKDVAVVNAEAEQKVQVVKAQADKESAIHIAEGKLQSTKKDAEGVKALGEAKADAESKMLLAPVNAQITLANEIGSNEGYQSYLVTIRQVEATEAIGKEMAGAMKEADLKIIANSGDVQGGIGKLADVFTPSGGTSIAGMLSALGQTAEGKSLLDGITAKLNK